VITKTRLHAWLSTIGSAGDVNPFIAISRELVRRGHRATLVTSSFFETQARSAGLGFVGLGSAEDYRRTVDDPDLWDPKTGFRVFAQRVVIPAIQPVYDILSANMGPDTVLVAQGQTFGAHLAHEKSGAPFVTANLQPAALRSLHDAPLMPRWMPTSLRPAVYALIDRLVLDRELAPGINAIRSRLGLPKVSRLFASWAHSPQKSLGLFPDWFAPPQPDWPPQTELTGFVFLDEDASPLAPELAAFLAAGEPPIVFTPGTAMKHADLFFRDSIRASMELGRRAILLTRYPDQVPTPLPDGIAYFAYAPFASLLPRVAALVHHGGIGTVAQALAAGIPQLVRPMTFDQPDNAARLTRLGVGATLRPGQYESRVVARVLQALLDSRAVAESCRRYASRIVPADALAAACDAIEAVAAHRGPARPGAAPQGVPR